MPRRSRRRYPARRTARPIPMEPRGAPSRLRREKAEAEAAIVEERSRIARELHDIVAHSISVMVLQARGGRRMIGVDPAEAREAFAVIEGSGRQALEEMRRLLGMLRASDEELALVPQPSLEELDTLVEQVRTAGLPVEVAVEGEPSALPPGVDLSAYRIVQEALTNALKHAGPARARVTVGTAKMSSSSRSRTTAPAPETETG